MRDMTWAVMNGPSPFGVYMNMKWRIWACALVLTLAVTSFALAAQQRVVLKDGTVLVGEVSRVGSSLSIVMPDGSRKLISISRVESIDGKPLDGQPAAGAAPVAAGPATAGGAEFQRVKSRVDRMEDALLCVQTWEQFIADNPDSKDLEAAKKELEMYQQLVKDKAEKIKGKWVGGDELKQLKERVDALVREGTGLENIQTQQAIRKYEEALRLMPRHYLANFRLGYFLAHLGRPSEMDKSIRHMEIARDMDPTVPEVYLNLAALYNFRRRFEDSIVAADTALQIFNDPEIVGVYQKALEFAPAGIIRNNPRVRDIVDRNRVIVKDVGSSGGSAGGGVGTWTYYPPGFFDGRRAATGGVGAPPGVDDKRQGMVWSGSGFFITPDGYLLTNNHVATGDQGGKGAAKDDLSFRIRMDDGTEKIAKLIAVDTKADIALMKVEPDPGQSFPYLRIANDNPPPADNVLVLGYPATGTEEASLQVNPGTVKSIHPNDEHNVWFDLSTTHGNSGGPIVDREGRVISILTAGRTVHNVTYVLGVGPIQMKTFLDGLGEKAPTIEYSLSSESRPAFDGVSLAAECRKATLYIMVIRGAPGSADTAAGTTTTTPGEPGTPAQPGQPAPGTPGDGEAPANPPGGQGGAVAPDGPLHTVK